LSNRVYNFSAGPATLPLAVLEQIRDELTDWHGSGMSVMEMSHRGKEFMSIYEHTEATLRRVMNIPDNYRTLFLQGGASSQFAMVPMNLLRGKDSIDVIHTGVWSKKTIAEAKRYCKVNVAASSEPQNFSRIPAQDELSLSPDAAYVHMTGNNTIFGTEYDYTPDTGGIPLVNDASSYILSRPMNVSDYGVIYAGAQKNIGIAGLTLVVVRDDLIGHAPESTPVMFNYKTHADTGSMYNTPPTFAIYVAGLVFDWIDRQGGVTAVEQANKRKAEKLYDFLDASGFYQCPTEPRSRSRMNVPFTLADSAQDQAFLSGAAEAGLVALKGHRLVGGMRASIYNAMPEEGVDALIDYMADFEKTRG